MRIILSLLFGLFFGTILIASQAFHWYRIQEMFHFDSFNMFGLLGSAIATGALGVWILKKKKVLSLNGNPIEPKKKSVKPVGNTAGGLLFGIGWGITGACTAPIFILVGWNWQIGLVCIAGALLGTIIFAATKNRLPR